MLYKFLIVLMLTIAPSIAGVLYECSDGFLVSDPEECKEQVSQ